MQGGEGVQGEWVCRGEQEDAASSLQALIPEEGELRASDSSDPGPRDGLTVHPKVEPAACGLLFLSCTSLCPFTCI